jgi:hypothetical protein
VSLVYVRAGLCASLVSGYNARDSAVIIWGFFMLPYVCVYCSIALPTVLRVFMCASCGVCCRAAV